MGRFALCCLVAFAMAGLSQAEPRGYPNRNITVVVPIGAGNAIENILRAMSPFLSRRLGQSVIIEAKPGGGMSIGATYTANAAPDGRTLMAARTGVYAINPTFFKSASYSPETDFVPVSLFGENYFVLVVNPELPVKTVRELIAYSKANPGQVTYAGSTLGGVIYLAGEILKKEVNMLSVPYKGGAPASLNDVIAGHVSMTFADLSRAPGLVKAGKLRALAVSSRNHVDILPDVPTFAEVGLSDLVVSSWTIMVAPAKTPAPVVERLHAEMKEATRLPEVVELMHKTGFEPIDSPPVPEMRKFMKSEIDRWGKIVRDAGLAGAE